VALGLLLPAVLALVLARTGMAALVLAGTVGLVLTGWLMVLGAPDVALTLMLVEVLTVVVAAPVLARRAKRPPRLPGSRAAGAALAAGALAGGLVFVLTGRRERSAVADYYLAEAEPATGGSNVVNTILVDFRGLDTLGEIVVLAAAALGLLAVGRALAGPSGRALPAPTGTLGAGERLVLRAGAAVVLPLLGLTTVVLFLRGHDLPGGGFIAGLLAGAGLAVARMSGIPVRLPSVPHLVATGLLLALGTAIIGLVGTGSLLAPLKVDLPLTDASATTSLVFDLGVVIVVLALVRSALDNLGSGTLGSTPTREEVAR
jgi:multicomponent Na+:H+ antiporter subunit A